MPSRAVVWFRRDLRVTDHPALLAALDAADEVVPVFVVDRTLLRAAPAARTGARSCTGQSGRWPATWRPSAAGSWSARATPSP